MTTASGDPIAAITEAQAQGEIADIYADIRTTLGVPLVNLVWRHLATVPGALAWAWGGLRPIYRDGLVAAAAASLAARLRLPTLALPGDEPPLTPPERMLIANVLRSYGRSNPMNWLALNALLQANAMPPSGTDAASEDDLINPPSPSEATADIASLPTLIALSDMPPELASRVWALDGMGNPHPQRILASMYRHLAHVPALLDWLEPRLDAMARDGRLALATQSVEAAAGAPMRMLIGQLRGAEGGTGSCERGDHSPIRHPEGDLALREFMERIALPRMIAVTGMLSALRW